jgi:hypothetical protein
MKPLGFKLCNADPCLFASNSCICLVYVEVTLLFAPSQVEIEDGSQGLKNLDINLEEEDEVAGFLGVLILRHPGTNPTLELLQTGLPQRVVDVLQIFHLPPKRTPAKLGVVRSDPEGDQPDCSYSYRNDGLPASQFTP